MKKLFFSAGYFLLLIYAVLLAPIRRDFNLSQAERLRLHPIVDSVKDLFDRHGSPWYWHVFYFSANFFGNIIMFMPFSFVMIWVFNMTNVWKIAATACLLSLTIEIVQYYTRRGVADIDDVILNTIGAIVGAYICRYFQNNYNYFIHR